MLSCDPYLTGILLLLIAVKGNSAAVVHGPFYDKEVTEVTYGKDELGGVYSKQISEEGDSLLIGSMPVDKKGKAETSVKCIKNLAIAEYNPDYDTQIFKRSTHDYQPSATESRELKPISDYFIVAKREMWNCHNSELSFVRVIHHLVGKVEIRGIRYYDGIDITTKYHLHPLRTAKIREVKYFWVDETGPYVVRYLGKLKEEEPNEDPTIIMNFNKNLFFESAMNEFGPKTYTKELDSEHKKVRDTGKAGISLAIEYAYPAKHLGDSSTQAICIQETGVQPFSHQYEMDFYEVVTHYEKVFQANIEKKTEYFIPIIQEIWFCETKGANKIYFMRVVNEAIGLKAVRKVTFHEGVTLFSIKLDDNSYAVRVRDVRYFDAFTYAETKYLGGVALVNRAKPPPSYPVEISYVLNENRLYKLFIGATGYDIRVGSTWEKEITSSNLATECRLDAKIKYLRSYRTKFRLKMRTIDSMNRPIYSLKYLNKDQKDQFISYLTQEVSICTDSTRRVKRFLRVFNEMKVSKPVHEVEFQEGIYVFDEILDIKYKTVRIVEIKYLDLEGKRVIKYDGEVKFVETKELGSPSVLSRDSSSAQPMKVTEDDIFWRVGHYSDVNKDIVDIDSYMRERSRYSGKIDFKDSGEFYVVFNGKPVATIGKQDDTAECKPTKDHYDLHCNFKEKGTKNVKNDLSEAGDLDKFFKERKTKNWQCQLPSGDEFNLQKDERVLKDVADLPSPYTNNICYFEWAPSKFSEVYFKMNGAGKSYLNTEITSFVKKITDPEGKVSGSRRTFNGNVLYDAGIDSPERMSGTIRLELDEEKLTTRLNYLDDEIEYKVGRNWIYVSQLDSKAEISLLIGVKWTTEFGNDKTVMNCKKADDVDLGVFDSFFQTRVRTDGDEEDSKKDTRRKPNKHLFDEYFEIIKQEVWQCENDKNENEKMLRILNHFYIKKHKCDAIKQLFYHDGVSILLGPNPNAEVCTEIVEVKYMDEDYKLLKFEGKIQLKGQDDKPLTNEITARKLKEVAKLEVHYLPAGEVHKTSVSNKGLVLEIGDANADTIKVRSLICKEATYSPAHRYKFIPVIKMNKYSQEKGIEQETMSEQQILRCFDYEMTMMDCRLPGDEEIKATRVVNDLKVTAKCFSIATIFYYDGVVIDKEPKLTIRETKFYKNRANLESIRVVGFVHLEEKNVKTPPLGQGTPKVEAAREIYYKLDTRRLHVKQFPAVVGPIIEIGSPFKRTFGSRADTVLCNRKKDHYFDKQYKMQIFSSLKGKQEPDRAIALNDADTAEYFEFVKQEVWTCVKNKKEAFIRVLNVCVALKDISRIYHPDGVLIGTQVFPNNEKSVQIREIKYLEPGTLTPLKYDGKLTLVAILSNKATSLFQMPSEYKEYEIEMQEPDKVNAASVKYWSLDVLRVFAMKQRPKADQFLPEIIYPELKAATSEQQAADFQHRKIDRIEGAHGIRVLVGSKYDRVLEKSDDMKCMLDEWNLKNEKKFNTKIRLEYENDFFELDADTILEYFNINSIEVWICVDRAKDVTMLRIKTIMTGVKEVYMVVKYPGVEVETISLDNGGKSVKITETKYMDAKDFKVLRFEGKLKMIDKLPKPAAATSTLQIAIEQPADFTPPVRTPFWYEKLGKFDWSTWRFNK